MHKIIRAVFVLAALFLFVSQGHASPPLIQGQGSSPYCLFAVNAYLAGVDMWQLEAEYHRHQLPTWPGTVIPKNPEILDLASKLYGTRWHVHGYQDFEAAKWGVIDGRATAFTGNGHAIVVIGWQHDRVEFVDSLHPQQVQVQTEAQLRAMWDGWAWYADHRPVEQP